MIRLSPEDFEDPHELAKYAATANISLDNFRKQFYYLVANEPSAKSRQPETGPALEKTAAKSETKSETPAKVKQPL